MVAVAGAPDPPPPVRETAGAEWYPLPAVVTVTDVTDPLIVDVAAAPDPPPPVKVTLGAEVYPEPPAVTVMDLTTLVIAEAAVAFVQPLVQPVLAAVAIVTVGAEV